VVDWEQSGFRPALKSLLEGHQQLLQQMVSEEQQHRPPTGNCWPHSGSGAPSTRSDFPTSSRLSGVREAFSPLALGSTGVSPGFLGETPTGFVFLQGSAQAGRSRWGLLVVQD